MFVANAVVVWLTVGCSAVFFQVDGDVAYGLTAAHCGVKEGEVVNAKFQGSTFGCRVVSVDEVRDMALLKCFSKEIPPVDLPISPASPGEVILVGFPAGKLTAVRGEMRELSMPMGRSFKQVITTDEKIEGGFSGGAVISEDGLVGIVTHSASTPVGSGAGCSLTDRLVEAGASKVLKTEPIEGVSIRDFIMAFLGTLLSRWFPAIAGRSPVTEVASAPPVRRRAAK